MMAMLASAATADAKKKKAAAAPPLPEAKYTYAAFVVKTGKPNPALYKALLSRFVARPASMPGVRLLVGKDLKAALKTDPDAAATKCGGRTDCIADLGKKAGAQKVLLARVAPGKKGISVQWLVVKTDNREVENYTTFEGATAKGLKSTMDVQLAGAAPAAGTGTGTAAAGPDGLPSLEGIPPVPGAAAALPPLAAADGKPASAPPAGTGTPASPPPAPAPAAPPGPVADASGGATGTSAPGAPTNPPAWAAGAGTPPAAPGQEEQPLALVTSPAYAPSPGGTSTGPGSLAATYSPSESAPSSHLWRYMGTGIAGVGVVGLALGAFFGMQAQSDRNSIVFTGAKPTTQLDAKSKVDSANKAVNNANLFFVGGGAAAFAGVALLAADLFIFDHGTLSPSVTATPNAVHASLLWRF